MKFYENFGWLHPIRALHIVIRRAFLRWDANASHPVTGDFDGGTIPPNLQQFHVGELLPWKGVSFKVGKVVGEPFPAVILVPRAPTHGQKLRVIRNFRDVARIKIRREREVRAALGKEAS